MAIEVMFMFGSLLLLVILIIIAGRQDKLFGLTNAVVIIIYSLGLFYQLLYNSKGGSSLLWMFYLAVFIWVQILLLLVWLVAYFVKKRKENSASNASEQGLKFKEYQVVVAKRDINSAVKKGTHGTILIVFDSSNFLVEFIDDTGESLNDGSTEVNINDLSPHPTKA